MATYGQLIEMAESAVSAQAFQRASTLYEEAATLQGVSLGRLVRDAQSAFEEGDTPRTFALYAEVATHHPLHLEAQLFLAKAHLSQGELEKASVCLELVLTVEPSHAEALALFGVLLDEQDMPDKAHRSLELALQREPKLFTALYHLGRMLADKDVERAISLLERALSLRPDDVDVFELLALIHWNEGRLTKATSLLLDATELQPENVELHFQLARILCELGEWQAASVEVSKAVQCQPDDPTYLSVAINLFLACDEHTLALECAKKLASLRPDGAEGWSKCALVSMARGELNEAEAFVTLAHQQEPEHWEPLFLLGEIHRSIEEYDKARECFSRSRERAEGTRSEYKPLLNMALTLIEQDDKEREEQDSHSLQRTKEALVLLEKAFALPGNKALILYNTAIAYATLGLERKVQSTLEQILKYTKRRSAVFKAAYEWKQELRKDHPSRRVRKPKGA